MNWSTTRTVIVERKTVTVNGKLVSSTTATETRTSADGQAVEVNVVEEVGELQKHVDAIFATVDRIFRKVCP